VLTHLLNNISSNPICLLAPSLMCLAGLGALRQLLLLFLLSPLVAGSHFAFLELLLRPCGGLLAASFSQFKASSLAMLCTPKAVCHCLPLGGEADLLGLGGFFLSCLRGTCSALASAGSGRFCGEALPVSTSGESAQHLTCS